METMSPGNARTGGFPQDYFKERMVLELFFYKLLLSIKKMVFPRI